MTPQAITADPISLTLIDTPEDHEGEPAQVWAWLDPETGPLHPFNAEGEWHEL